MRTTITLDRDVAQRARAVVARSGKSFKQVVNEAMRTGLEHLDRASSRAKPYRMKGHRMGLRPGLSIDSIQDLIEHSEGPESR